jgi:GTPase Era involved in 16S rRNA processing
LKKIQVENRVKELSKFITHILKLGWWVKTKKEWFSEYPLIV